MKTLAKIILCAAVAGSGPLAAVAQDTNPAVAARQAQMRLQLFYMAPIGGMARGKIPYDATAAQVSADAVAALSSYDWSRYWAPGTDGSSMKGTYAKPELFQNLDDVKAKEAALHKATLALQEAAGKGLDPMKAAAGQVFGACGACHKAYRMPMN